MDSETSEPSTWGEYEKQATARIVASINYVRNARGLTINQLRERLVDAGWTVSLSTLNGILSTGKRGSISVNELEAFALALEVSPLFLVLELPARRSYRETGFPLDETQTDERAIWWMGSRSAPRTRSEAWELAGTEFKRSQIRLGTTVNLLRYHAASIDAVYWQNALLTVALTLGNDALEQISGFNELGQRETPDRRLAYVLVELSNTRFDLNEDEIPLPELHPALAFIDDLDEDEILSMELPVAGLPIDALKSHARSSLRADIKRNKGKSFDA